MADVPQKPSRGHCGDGLLHRPNAHVWCSVLLFRHRPNRRKILHFNVTRNPHALWVVQQLREAWCYKKPHRFLLFDRDAKFGANVVSAVREMGSEPTRTAFHSPWQNGVAEHWVGSCRRDLLEHVIILNERHLKRLMSRTYSTTMRTGHILDSRRTRQQVGLQKVALSVEARFNPSRESAGCTIVMRWPRRFVDSRALFCRPNAFSCKPSRGAIHVFCEHFRRSRISLQSQTEELTSSGMKSF
jgi:hypothetical protein